MLRVIKEGRQATQMMGFGDLLSGAEIQALADWIRTPVVPAPRWTAADITASRIATPLPAGTPNTPLWQADPMNLFVVVEGGDHHISLLDGDKFEVIERFRSRFALHRAGPKFTRTGATSFLACAMAGSPEYDLYRLQVVAEVRAGLNMRNVAVSADGQWVMAANYLPHTLALFDADLNLVKTYDAATQDGTEPARASRRCTTRPRATALSWP